MNTKQNTTPTPKLFAIIAHKTTDEAELYTCLVLATSPADAVISFSKQHPDMVLEEMCREQNDLHITPASYRAMQTYKQAPGMQPYQPATDTDQPQDGVLNLLQ